MKLNELSQKITKPLALKQRESLIYVERSKVHIKDNQVVVCNKASKNVSVPIADITCLMLGPGTSITNEAVKAISRRDTCLIWSGGGGLPVHNFSGNYRSPKNLLRQASLFLDNKKRLDAAKFLIKKRNLFLDNNITKVNAEEVDSCNSVQNVMLCEARWAKSFYKEVKQKYNLNNPYSFVKLSNFFCYGLVTPLIIGMGLNPNIGILHGENRGGGLIFDIADLIKPICSVIVSAEALKLNLTENELKKCVIDSFDKNNFKNKIIDTISELYDFDS